MKIQIDLPETSTNEIIYSDEYKDILNLSVAKIQEMFKSSGIILFRGFGITHELMQVFAEQFSSRFTRDDDKPLVEPNGFVSSVDIGMHEISPHRENGSSPFSPDAVWFCCTVPAAEGGETLFWDGIQVWQKLSEELRNLFISKKIKFVHKFPADKWKHFLGSDATISDAKRVLDGFNNVKYQIDQEESIYTEYICSSVVQTKYGNQSAFVNDIITGNSNLKGSVNLELESALTFEDGSLIPDAVIEEIEKVMYSLTQEILWQAGDLVMIDNSRFLHGRRAFNDNRRRLFALLSYLNF
ncbi:TauD/TfdA family dioxygenase [Nostoc punctiforme UO1]|uniref:TauD/TfdA family dioxygenase n=1 Tax=Nostoc punctiforme TaxID=272131 RepID=UPI0030978C1B